ncbi:MAG: hypothetical protein ABJC62_05620 [Frankiaceae bacterium]
MRRGWPIAIPLLALSAGSAGCGSDVGVLVLQNGSKYILRGETDVRFAGGPTLAPPTADPVGSRWLAGTYRPAVERFNRYQQTVERYPSPAAAAPSG